MLKLLAKISEKYAKSTNTACHIFWFMHQPKMPASLIKKD
jgi:cyclic lactone autoinducer peptide